MRYHFEKPEAYQVKHGEIYICNHPVYNRCTLFRTKDRGLAVIQQRFDRVTKRTWWGEIDPWLMEALYNHKNFSLFFDKMSGPNKDNLYPTVTIRQIMWSLRMKPLEKCRWETVFDRKVI